MQQVAQSDSLTHVACGSPLLLLLLVQVQALLMVPLGRQSAVVVTEGWQKALQQAQGTANLSAAGQQQRLGLTKSQAAHMHMLMHMHMHTLRAIMMLRMWMLLQLQGAQSPESAVLQQLLWTVQQCVCGSCALPP